MKGRAISEVMVKDGEDFPLRVVEEPHVGIIGRTLFFEEGLPEDIEEAWGCGCCETVHIIECAIREEWGNWGLPVSDAAAYVARETVGMDNFKPLRHTSFTFYLDGVSLGALDMISSFPGVTCTSWRIVPSTGMLEFVPPRGVHQGMDDYEEWMKLCVNAREAFTRLYNESLGLKSLGESRTIAQSVLPRCTATSAMVTANAETWRELIKKYRAYGSDPEVQKVTQKIRELLDEELPGCFSESDLNAM